MTPLSLPEGPDCAVRALNTPQCANWHEQGAGSGRGRFCPGVPVVILPKQSHARQKELENRARCRCAYPKERDPPRHGVIPVPPGKGTGSPARSRRWSSVAALRLNRRPKAKARQVEQLILRHDKPEERLKVTVMCHSFLVRRVFCSLKQTRKAAEKSQVNSAGFAGNSLVPALAGPDIQQGREERAPA